MTIAVARRVLCRLCDDPHLDLVVPLAATTVAEKYVTQAQRHEPQPRFPLDLYMCAACGHVQLLDVIDAAFLYDDFTYQSGNTRPLIDHFGHCARQVRTRYQRPAGSLVVDVGSNDGSLLRCFAAEGFRVLGIDPAVDIARQATAAGIPTIPMFLTAAVARALRDSHGPASVVCAFNVFAHADDLGGMLDAIRQMLAPDGIFVFEVSYLLDVLDGMLLGTIFHEHMSYHSLGPMVPFLRRHGMQVIDVERVAIQGGSLVGTAQLAGGPQPVNDSVANLLALEQRRGLDRPETLKAFATKLQAFSARLAALVTDLQRQGKTIWGYGAARSGTTLIAQMGLGQVIAAIVDDSADKQGKFSPGDHIPILPVSALYEARPDYAFILAWIHADRIIANNRAYLDQGGHFIVCFPEVRIVGADTVREP